MVDRLKIGRVAMGTAPLGGLYGAVPESTALATFRAAAEGGVTHFDTAPHYGRGLAEERLGRFLRSHNEPERFTVSTKVGRQVRRSDRRSPEDVFLGAPPGESVFDFSVAGVRAQLDASRSRIGREHIDLALLHDPDEHLEDALAACDELSAQRAQGRVGAVGVGTNRADVVHHLLDRVPLDIVLLAGRITLLETSGESVAERCSQQGIPLIAAGVFQSGILAGDPGANFDYSPAPEKIRQRVAELADVCLRRGVTLHEAALNHPGRVAGVTTTLVGLRSPAEVADALGSIGKPLPSDLWDELDALRKSWMNDGVLS